MRKRAIATVVVIAFVVFGVVFFGGRIPKEVALRFEVPPTLGATDGGSFSRALLQSLGGVLMDERGTEIGRVSIPIPNGLELPLAPPVGLQLKKGNYGVRLRARARDGRESELRGAFTVEGAGEVRVDLRVVH